MTEKLTGELWTLSYLHLYPLRWLTVQSLLLFTLSVGEGRVEACDLLPALIPQEGDSKANAHILSTEDLLLVLQNLSKLPNSSGASFWTGAAGLTHYLCPWLSICCHVFTLWKSSSSFLTFDSILSIFCDGHRPWLSYAYTQYSPFTGRNKGKPWSNIIPPSPNTRRITHGTSWHLVQNSLEEPVVAQTQPSTAAGPSAGTHECKLGKSSHICPNKAHVSTIRQMANYLRPPIPSHLIAYGTWIT